MYSTRTATTLTVREMLEKLNDYDIYKYYLGNIQVGRLYNSPLRNDDQMPSFAIFQGRNGGLLFKDHGIGLSGNAVKFIELYRQINTREDLERELLRILKAVGKNPTISRTFGHNGNTLIEVMSQPLTPLDRRYWWQFHIKPTTLKKFNVHSIKYFLCNRVVRGTYKESSPMYAYKVDDKYKIYRPLAPRLTKWRSNLTNRNVQGLAELPEGGGSLLIITKSLKDVMVLYEMGYNAIAASSETTFIPDDILNNLRTKWNNILILYDRDKTGVIKSRELSKKYKLDAFFVHKKFKAKDISDAVRYSGFDKVEQWLNKTLEKYVDIYTNIFTVDKSGIISGLRGSDSEIQQE